jgi:hypothetical protein
MKMLPIGIQSFAKLMENGCIYVDKTREIRNKRYYERFPGERQVSLPAVAFAGNKIGCRMEATTTS